MFSGLMSRCTMPLAWAAAERRCDLDGHIQDFAGVIGCARIRSRRVEPSMNSVAMNDVESV